MKLSNLVLQTSLTTGTQNFALTNFDGYNTFAAAFPDNDVLDKFYYFIKHDTLNEWEVGEGYIDGGLLVRTAPAVIASSAGAGVLVNFSAGTKKVVNDAPADFQEKLSLIDEKQNIVPRVATIASSATPTPNAETTDLFVITALGAAAVFGAPTGTPAEGQAMFMRVKDNGTARALSFNAIYRPIGITLPTTTVLGKTMYLGMVYNSVDTKWDVLSIAQEA